MSKRLGIIATLLFGSGVAALVYQTVWQKLFLFVFGATSDASAAVLGIFLGGLGLGSAVIGKRAEAHPKPLALYGSLELGIALWAAASPWFIDGATSLYAALGGSQTMGRPLATLVRLTLASLAIGPAAFLMGGTLPAAARAAVALDDVFRRGLARIYALNTLGAVVGALAGPLLFFGTWGVRATLYAAVALNVTVALSARHFGRQKLKQPKESSPPSPGMGSSVRREVIFALAGVVGFAFLFMELVWFRMLAPILGGSSITFGLILAVALAGIGAGGFLYSATAHVGGSAHRVGLHTLTLTLCLEALFIVIPFAWGDDLAIVTAHLRAMESLGYGGVVGGWIVIAFAVVFPAAAVSGYQFPVVFALLGQGRAGVAKEVGHAYAFNTAGAIAGSLLGGFLLLPALGATGSWRLAAALLLVTALGLAAFYRRPLLAEGRPLLLGGCGILATALLFADGPGAVWRHTPIGAGRVSVSEYDRNQTLAWSGGVAGGILWEADGREVAVAVENRDGISFLVNGKSDGSVAGDRGTQIMLGLLPAALHSQARRSFVVGLGTGTTAGMLGLLPETTRVDVAEIEPIIREVAAMSEAANGNVLGNRKVHVLEGDARELLLSRDQMYDLIVSEPSNPYRVGVANLFTREFYQLAASRLDEGGLFAQWIQGYEIDAATLSTAIITLKTSFKTVSLWNSQGGDLILVASQGDQTIELDRLRTRLATEPFRTWFPRARFVEGAEAFVAQQLIPAGRIDLLTSAAPGVINTDDLNLLEHAFARSVGTGAALKDQLRDMVLGHAITPTTRGDIDASAVLQARPRLNSGVRWPAAPKSLAVATACAGKMSEGMARWPADAVPQDVTEHWVLGYARAMSGDEGALSHASALKKRGFNAEASLMKARLHLAEKDTASAVTELSHTFALLQQEALPLCDAPERALRFSLTLAKAHRGAAAQLFDALAAAPFSIFIREGQREDTLTTLAQVSGPGGTLDKRRCVAAFGALEPYPTWDEEHLTRRMKCYSAAADPRARAAGADLARFLRNQPSRFLPDNPQLPHPLPEQRAEADSD